MIDSPPRILLCCFVDCCLMRQYLLACLIIRLPQYSFGLAALPPHGDIPSALWPRPLLVIFLRPCGVAPSWRYSFGLAALPPHGNIPSALRPCPLMAIFLRLCGLAPSQQYSFGLAASPSHGDIPWALRPCPLTAKSIFYSPHGECRFIFLMPPHGKIKFLFASRRMSIFYSPDGA